MLFVEQELISLPEHMSSAPVYTGVRIARSFVFFVMFCRSLLVLLSFLDILKCDFHITRLYLHITLMQVKYKHIL